MIIVTRDIIKVDVENVSLDYLTQVYEVNKQYNHILLIYTGDEFYTLISYEDYIQIFNENTLNFYLQYSNNHYVLMNKENSALAEEIFESNTLISYCLIEQTGNIGVFFYKYYTVGDEFVKMKKILMEYGVKVYCVNVPCLEEIKNKHNGNIKWSLGSMKIKNMVREEQILFLKPYFFKISNVDLNETDKLPGKRKVVDNKGNNARKIFLVGPCIISGTCNPEGEELSSILYEKLSNLQYGYEIENVIVWNHQQNENVRKILEKDIRKNDIVIFLMEKINENDLDLTHIYNEYKGEKWLYQDMPIHTTVTGNELIAEEIIEKIIKVENANSNSSYDNEIVYYGEPHFTYEYEREIYRYIDSIKKVDCSENKVIGAIVMNCNPFTKGHRHLVEYASSQVDYLYLFVVEEDLSVFPFYDRFLMVYEGVKDLTNVMVVPSGKFIISKDTFLGYFEKETEIVDIDSATDVYIFARYIARGLHITKRFVGEEPLDYVTNSYNEKMQEVLPKYGVELVVIPRKKTDKGEIISATNVRAMLYEEKGNLAELVPNTTLKYLEKNKNFILDRTNYLEIQKELYKINFKENAIGKIVEFISTYDKVVIYGLGIDAKKLLSYLPEEQLVKLVYCDKKADSEEFFYNSKKVVRPSELLDTYKEYHIVVTSSLYNKDIYNDFCNMGIDMDRCIFNTVGFFYD